MATAFSMLMNQAMRIEREHVLQAESHQRTTGRPGYADGFKPKSLQTRVGEVSLQIPQARDYHDENGHPFYPPSLDRGVRSERALTLAVAEMYVQGASARKASKIQNVMAHVPKMATARMLPGTCVASSMPTSPLKRSAVSARRSPATRKQLLIPASWLEDYYPGSPHRATNPGAPPPQTSHHTWTETHQ